MSDKQDRIESILDERRVKLHLFNPSKREIWTVIGKEKEHWIDPNSNFCSCSGYYFGMIKNKTACYHLESISKAKKENKFETIKFVDDEYESFISGIVSDL
jgi:predicted nucleic acid-binding Zn finger protein